MQRGDYFESDARSAIPTSVTSHKDAWGAALMTVKDLLGEKPLVFDREFSYLELLEKLVAERVHFVIRLNLGSHPPLLTNATNPSP